MLFEIFLPVVNLFLLPSEIGNIYEKAGKQKPVRGLSGFWWFIPIAGYFIWINKVQTAMNDRWEEMGAVRASTSRAQQSRNDPGPRARVVCVARCLGIRSPRLRIGSVHEFLRSRRTRSG